MPPAPDVQEKIVCIQDKLQALQQHEANDQCNGGSQCILQSPMFAPPIVVDSPQVTSTTGRGRTKGTPRTKKSRKKADKEAEAPMLSAPITQSEQPLSDNLVTTGDGSNVVESAADSIEDLKPSSGDLEEEWTKTKKPKPRKPRKPKEPRDPNKEPKEIKESKEAKPKKDKESKSLKEPKTPKDKSKKKKEGKEALKKSKK